MSDLYGGYSGGPELDPDAEPLAYALERAILGAVLQFQDAPDSLLRDADLKAAVAGFAQQEELLTRLLETRDHRLTRLLHSDMPSYMPQRHGNAADYDLALLHPNWVRGNTLAAAANLGSQGTGRWASIRRAERPTPLLAAAILRIVEELANPAVMDALLLEMNELALAHSEVVHRYVVILCRNWDLDNQIRKTIGTLQLWCERHRSVSVVVAQAHRDEIGAICGGRYLNHWRHMAPFAPL